MVVYCVDCRLRQDACVCEFAPTFKDNLAWRLITHSREYQRNSNTGWLLHTFADCRRIVWQRSIPCQQLIHELQQPSYAPILLYPQAQSETSAFIEVDEDTNQPLPDNILPAYSEKTPLLLLLDGSWQEAQKMVNRSPYLQSLPIVSVIPSTASQYRLRRNQQDGNLATVEVASKFLRILGYHSSSQALMQYFQRFQQHYEASQSGHGIHSANPVDVK